MIKIVLRGGLGNQMFQYAAGLGVAKQQGAGIMLDTTFLNDRFPRRQFTYRSYDLDIFDIAPKFSLLSEISAQMSIPGLWLGFDLVAIQAASILGIKKLLKEEKDTFDSTIFHYHAASTLWGFWQSEKYFENAKSEVRAAFHFRPTENVAIVAAKKEIMNSNAVAIHVRRGDYLFSANANLYEATGGSYYDRAIGYISEHVSSPKFFVFSDDIAWCRENIKAPGNIVFMDARTAGPKASGHLELMSLCKHNIIAASSFSWWGAWLNSHVEKIVVAPERWSATIPEGWITF